MKKYWANKRMDGSFGDWWFAVRSCLAAPGNDAVDHVEAWSDPDEEVVVGLSVRSLFDLWLSAKGWRPGDRIVFSAFTVADMPYIARAHGLEVAAVDIDPLTGEPDIDVLRDVVDDRTRAVVYTHLFGARGDVTPVLALAHERGALLVEDCAEAYAGPRWRGHGQSDLVLFSFGPIKTATAFGGGLARVRDSTTRTEMLRLAAAMPRQPRVEYLRRLMKYGVLAAATDPRFFAVLVRLLDRMGLGHDAVLNRLTRGFPGPDLLRRIRRRPPAPMVRMLDRRLGQGDQRLMQRVGLGHHLVSALDGVVVPTSGVPHHGYWLVPVLAPDPEALVRRLASAGFHATRGRAFAVVEHDPGVRARAPIGAHELYEQVVYLPFAPGMPTEVLDDLARLVRDEVAQQCNVPFDAGEGPQRRELSDPA
jgi:dTDP-4-amino-4,6-dideoxygalactose transaminase